MPNQFGQRNEERLDSWKEIANYLDRGVRTVIRWEKTEGLPVHRHPHEKRSSVFAYRSEIEDWRRSRPPALRDSEPAAKRNWWVWTAALAGLLLVAALVWLRHPKPEPGLTLPLNAEPLTSYPGHQYSPSFSPDGNHFAFAWDGPRQDNFDIYVQAIGMSEPRRLTDHPYFDYGPAWSPDGRWIAFLRRTPQLQVEVRVVPAMGGSERKLTDLAIPVYQEATELAWSGDSKWLAFSDTDAGGPGLFLLSVEAGERRRLTKAERPRGHLDPSFSPDGRAVAFRCRNNEDLAEICVLPISTDLKPEREPEQVTHLGVRSTSPVWTADGNSLIFSSGVWLSDTSLYRMRVFPVSARSARPERLTAAAGEDQFSLGYARNGHLLAYTRATGDINIWALEFDGRRWKQEATISPLSSSRTDMEPDFSPDGQSVAFVSDRSGSMEVWVAKPNGAQPRQLTSLGPRIARGPQWSPDGDRIAFWCGGHEDSSILVIKAGGGPPRELVKSARDPSWSRDGKWLYYKCDYHGGPVRKIPAGGDGAAIEMIDGEASNPVESPDGRFLYYEREDGVWRMPTGGTGTTERVVAQAARFGFAFAARNEGLFTLEVFKGGHYRPSLKYHLFADSSATELTSITSGRTMLGLTVSPDGKTLLFCRMDAGRHNLMMVRGVR